MSSMSVSVDVPGQGRYAIPVSGATTAADAIARVRELLPPECPWHGSKRLSCGPSHLHPGEPVSNHISAGFGLVLVNYSELCLQESSYHLNCSLLDILCDSRGEISVFGYLFSAGSACPIHELPTMSSCRVARVSVLEEICNIKDTAD